MAELKKLGKRSLRLTCECGMWVHDLEGDKDGNVSVESFRTKKEDKEKPDAKRSVPKTEKEGSIFDRPFEGEEGEGTEE